jgi:uncharacterized protein (DUF1330 family)
MRAHYAVALAVVLGIGAGGSAMQVLRAQAKPPVYIVTEIAVSELSGYANEYAPRAQASILKAGGRILAASFDVIPLEGHPPKRVVIQVWDSTEQIAAWRKGPDYDEIRKIGEKYAIFRSFAVEGIRQ